MMAHHTDIHVMTIAHTLTVTMNQAQTFITFSIEDEDAAELGEEGWAHQFPLAFVVCDTCSGKGKIVNPSVECDGGGFTQSEWNEACYEDPDFADDYFSGVYDIACPECSGQRVIPWVNEELVKNNPDWKKVRKRIDELQRMEAEDAAMREAERRFGC